MVPSTEWGIDPRLRGVDEGRVEDLGFGVKDLGLGGLQNYGIGVEGHRSRFEGVRILGIRVWG